jgi:hypothetical protein
VVRDFGKRDRVGQTNMRENGRLIKNKVMEYLLGLMVLSIKVILLMILKRERDK